MKNHAKIAQIQSWHNHIIYLRLSWHRITCRYVWLIHTGFSWLNLCSNTTDDNTKATYLTKSPLFSRLGGQFRSTYVSYPNSAALWWWCHRVRSWVHGQNGHPSKATCICTKWLLHHWVYCCGMCLALTAIQFTVSLSIQSLHKQICVGRQFHRTALWSLVLNCIHIWQALRF